MSWDQWRENTEEKYHPNFKSLRGPRCLKRANGFCEFCNIQNGTTRENGSVVMLAACHLDHDYWNGRARLKALCQSCHNQWDSENRNKNKQITKCEKEEKDKVENGQIMTKLKIKGNQDKLRQLNRRHVFVDDEWEVRNFAPKSKRTRKPIRSVEQLPLFLEDEENAYPVIEVDFPVSQFMLLPMQSVETMQAAFNSIIRG